MSGKHLCRFPRPSACRRGLAIKNLLAFAVCGLLLGGFQARGGTYSQNFESVPIGTTGTGLGDGSRLVGAGGAPVAVQSSAIYTGVPASPDWKALFVTSLGANQNANYFLPNLDPTLPANTPVTSFQIDFTVLFSNQNSATFADGMSINFGKLNNTTSVYGDEYSMYNTVGGTATGDVLSVSFRTFSGTQGISALLNDVALTGQTTTVVPVQNSGNPPQASDFLPVSVFWDSNGLDVSYNGQALFTNLPTGAFSPTVDYQFAFAARNGLAFENLFLDNISATVVPEPSSLLLLAAAAVPAGAVALRRRRSRNRAIADGGSR